MHSSNLNRIKPPALKKGDNIGVIAPSEPLYDERRRTGVKLGEDLLHSLGYNVRFGEFIFESYYYMAGTPEQRLRDFHGMVSDASIKAIFSAWGGKSANHLIDLIDYDLVAQNPKIISGFSDSTNLINAIFAKTGIVTFHGPGVVGKLAELPPENVIFFEKALVSGNIGVLPWPTATRVFRHGRAEGTLVGGNLTCFTLSLINTSYQPNSHDTIFFWESGTKTTQEIDQYLTYLRLCGFFDNISGMIVGVLPEPKPNDNKNWNTRDIKDVILSVTSKYSFPVVQIPIFGHGVTWNVTLPVGCKALLDTNAQQFQILETCTS
jgi:muramoyltetrapeptide carboxypeptidase